MKKITFIFLLLSLISTGQTFKGFQKVDSSNVIVNAPRRSFASFVTNIADNRPNSYVIYDGLAGWWDSNTGITLVGSNVSVWADKVGGYSFICVTATHQPAYTTTDANYRNYPSIVFDGSNDTMSAGDVLDIGTGSYTVVVVGNYTSTGANKRIISKGATVPAAVGDWNMGISGSNLNLGQFWDNVSNKTSLSSASADVNKNVYTYCINRTAGVSNIWVNTVKNSNTTVDINSVNLNNASVLRLNSSAGNTAMTLVEILIYSRALTDAEINQNVANLKAKYGI